MNLRSNYYEDRSVNNSTAHFKTNKSKNIAIGSSFLIMGIVGALLLLSGYTQSGLDKVVFPSMSVVDQKKNLLYLLSVETLGVLFGMLFAMIAIKFVNIKWIFFSSFMLATVMLLLISFINKIVPLHPIYNRPIVFAFFSLLLGIGTGTSIPLTSTLVGTVYTGKRRAQMLSYSNACYGIIAGIIPIILSPIIYRGPTMSFSQVRVFYFVAAGLAVMTACVGLLVNYKHPPQTSRFKLGPNSPMRFSLWKPILIFCVLMVLYYIAEMVFNYMFVNLATSYINTKHWLIIASQAYGVYLVFKGIWRLVSAWWITPHVTPTFYIVMCALVGMIAVGMMLGGLMKYTWSLFLIGILAGIAVGNMYTTIFSYGVSVDHRRSSAIGMSINLFAQIAVPITQIVSATIWSGYAYGEVSFGTFFSTTFLIAGAFIALIICTLLAKVYFKKHPYLINTPLNANLKIVEQQQRSKNQF